MFSIESTNASTATLVTNRGTQQDVFDVGSASPMTGFGYVPGNVDDIKGPLTIHGFGNDTMNVNDTGAATAKTGTLTATSLTGLNMGSGGIAYSGLAFVNIDLGSGGNSFTIASTIAGQTLVNSGTGNDTVNVQTTNGPTTVNTGGGTNTINVGSLSPAVGGVVDLIHGALTVDGSGPDTMNVDDTGSTIAKAGTLTSTTLTGLNMGPGGVTFSGLAFVNINLGSGGNTFTIASTIPGSTFLNSGTGNDTVNVQTTSGPTTVNTGGGTNTVNVGSLSPAVGGIVDGIQGALVVGGSGPDTLNVDDTGSTIAKTGTLTSTTLTGLKMGPAGITYIGLAFVNINLEAAATRSPLRARSPERRSSTAARATTRSAFRRPADRPRSIPAAGPMSSTSAARARWLAESWTASRLRSRSTAAARIP